MDQRRLYFSSRLGEAEWLAPRLGPFGSGVASVVPDGFPAYSRILHPARGKNLREDPMGQLLQPSQAAQCIALYSFTPSMGRVSLFRRLLSPPRNPAICPRICSAFSAPLCLNTRAQRILAAFAYGMATDGYTTAG